MALEKGSNGHVFGRKRPSRTKAYPISMAPPRDVAFRPLPPPTGPEPFHLDLGDVIAATDIAAIQAKRKLTFHLNGDTGGIQYDVPQHLVARGMEDDINPAADPSERPAFLYVTGDCVYFNGEVSEYYKQFYEPYEFYPGPIFAVPGNHDGENLPGQETLDGFIRNFCAPKPVKMPESLDSHRTAMIQPNVFWTLITPLATFVGLYSNVPAGGDIRPPQDAWLENELRTQPTDRPLFVALHHPIYSADDHHSGSAYMRDLLEAASKAAGRGPDMILAGHVHNYQRISRQNADGTITPYLVTGAGGYHNLHHMQKVNGMNIVPPATFTDSGTEVVVHQYCDDHHGFMRMEITPELITGSYYHVPRPQDPYSKGNQLLDYFEYDWRAKQWRQNKL